METEVGSPNTSILEFLLNDHHAQIKSTLQDLFRRSTFLHHDSDFPQRAPYVTKIICSAQLFFIFTIECEWVNILSNSKSHNYWYTPIFLISCVFSCIFNSCDLSTIHLPQQWTLDNPNFNHLHKNHLTGMKCQKPREDTGFDIN